MDLEQAIRTRQKVFDQGEAQNILVGACHFPEPGFGHLVRDGGGATGRGFRC